MVVITAGTSDLPVAQEAAVTARAPGCEVTLLADVVIWTRLLRAMVFGAIATASLMFWADVDRWMTIAICAGQLLLVATGLLIARMAGYRLARVWPNSGDATEIVARE